MAQSIYNDGEKRIQTIELPGKQVKSNEVKIIGGEFPEQIHIGSLLIEFELLEDGGICAIILKKDGEKVADIEFISNENWKEMGR